ncbi:MAG: AEC family transporter [Firmicutes bacterium]|nr:AEC family transporter [Bacillota bacterium]
MDITEILTALLKIFILMTPGFVLKKLNIINTLQTDGIASIITRVTYPCLVVTAMQMDYSKEILANCPYIFLVYAGVMLVAFLLSKAVCKLTALPLARGKLLTFMLIFGNTGFIGLPVLNGLFGAEAVFYGAICDATCDIFMFTFGITILRSAAVQSSGVSKRPAGEIVKNLFNPCTIGVIIGLIFYVTGTELPEILGEPVSLLGSSTTPLAMFIIGAQLAEIRPKVLFSDKHIYLGSFLKLLVMPASALLLSHLFIGSGSLLAAVIVIEAAMPAAAASGIFTQQFGGDVEFAAKGVLMTTLLCILTIPLIAVLLSLL